MNRKLLFASLWSVLFILAFSSVIYAAQHASVFVYHRFGDARYPSTNIELPVFRQQLEYLKQNHYTVLPLGEIVDRLKSGQELPDKCVALTVDDGYVTFLTGAMPLLREYGFDATLFVNTDSVGAKSYLDWDQLRQLQQEGIEIGNHSASHPYFVTHEVDEPLTWYDQSVADVEKAQRSFEKHLNTAPQLFAYPYGEYSPQLENLIESLGFKAAVAQQSGALSGGYSFFSLPRFPMGGPFATLAGFQNKLSMRPMPITVQQPSSPVISDQNPPVLIFELNDSDLNLNSLLCYVQGQEPVSVEKLDNGLFRVVAKQPLAGRRNKYTLTAQSRDGRSWYWFSHLWVKP